MSRPKRNAQKVKDPDFDYGEALSVLAPSNHILSSTPQRRVASGRKRQPNKSAKKAKAPPANSSQFDITPVKRQTQGKRPVSSNRASSPKPRSKRTKLKDLGASPDLFDGGFGNDNLDDSDLLLGCVDIDEIERDHYSQEANVAASIPANTVIYKTALEASVSPSLPVVTAVSKTVQQLNVSPSLPVSADVGQVVVDRPKHDAAISGAKPLDSGAVCNLQQRSVLLTTKPDQPVRAAGPTLVVNNNVKLNVAGNIGSITKGHVSPSGVSLQDQSGQYIRTSDGRILLIVNPANGTVLPRTVSASVPSSSHTNATGWLSASSSSFQATKTVPPSSHTNSAGWVCSSNSSFQGTNTTSIVAECPPPLVQPGSVDKAAPVLLTAQPHTVISSTSHGTAPTTPVNHTSPTPSVQDAIKSTLSTHSAVTPSSFYPNPNTTPDVTPRAGSSIKDKIKRVLAQNAKCNTTPSSLDQKQVESRENAIQEAEDHRSLQSTQDVGPFYGLPTKVKELLENHRGISKLYDWQDECLSLPAVRQGGNLIYSLPTSGGKTLVAEILILRALLCQKKDVIFSLPFVAIVQEKVKTLSPFALDLEFLVEEYAASRGQIPPRKRRNRNSIYVCTIEKANALVNSLISEGRLSDVGLVVVDELHMLGEGGSRGACLEQSIVKVMHACPEIQIIGMSATLSNIKDLSRFMNAEIYSNNFRPVKLVEYVKMGDTLYTIDGLALCPDDRLKHHKTITFTYNGHMKEKDPDYLVGLVNEVIPKHSCLVFCPTKKNCENVAELLCRMAPSNLTEVKRAEKKALLGALWHDGNGDVCPVLQRTIPFGVAYHHSGLTMDERKLIEEAYTDGTLCLLTCTSTLAAGVNLPAKRVILRSPHVGLDFLSRSQYKQMVGRAGRAGLDDSGESILIIERKDRLKLLDLVSGPYDMCKSSLLYEESKGMRALLLTTIGLQITDTWQSAREFMCRTLCHIQSVGYNIQQEAEKALAKLVELDLVKLTSSQGGKCTSVVEDPLTRLEVTRIGRAVFKGPIDVDRGPQLYQDLCQAQQSLVVANHLHLLYLVTPYDVVSQLRISWMIYFEEINCLTDQELKVATLVGVSPSYIAKKATCQRTKQGVDEFVIKRFYLTLILYKLWKHNSIWDVAGHFMQPRGFIQGLLNSAAAFASCIAHFCRELEEFWAYQDLFASFVRKLTHCQIAELMPLMEIPGVKLGRARQLSKAGYKNMQQVAHADPADLTSAIAHMPKKVAKQIVSAAKMLVKDKVETLREEAEELIATPAKVQPPARVAVSPTMPSFSQLTPPNFSQEDDKHCVSR